MKIAIASDFHIGFGNGTLREREAFEQAKEAFELALVEKADLLLLAGDLFNDDVPSQEDWHQMFRLFSLLRKQKSEAKVKYSKGSEFKEFYFTHLPVIAIAGTHEFRGKDFKNALEVLQEAGCLVYLHAAKAELEIGGEKIVVQGLSGVPEKKALDALRMWNPLPEKNALNFLLLHQSIKDFLDFGDDMVATVSLSDLPKGFDLIVNGHLHASESKYFEERNFLMPGSTVITQMKKLESARPKGIFLFETGSKKIAFMPLPRQRKFFFEKIDFKGASPGQVKEAVEKKILALLESAKEIPLIKLKLKGSLAKGVSSSSLDLKFLEGKFGEKAIVAIDADFEEESFRQKLQQLRDSHLGKKSIAAMGFELLLKNLAETDFKDYFDAKRIFDLLAEGNVDKVVELLSEPKEKQPEKA